MTFTDEELELLHQLVDGRLDDWDDEEPHDPERIRETRILISITAKLEEENL